MPYSQSKEQLFRILKIVKRLYALEELKISQLAIDYAVCTKTIRRDLQNIAKIIPLQKRKTIYSIESKQQTHSHNDFQFNLLSAFASNADVLLECFDKENRNEDKIAFAMEFNHLSKQLGASAVLLTRKLVELTTLKRLTDHALSIGITPFVEIDSVSELADLQLNTHTILAICNRDIRTKETDNGNISKILSLLKKAHKSGAALIVSASAINDAQEAKQLITAGFDGLLIGTTFLQAENLGDSLALFSDTLSQDPCAPESGRT